MKGLLRIVLVIVALISLLGCEEAYWVPKVDHVDVRTDGNQT